MVRDHLRDGERIAQLLASEIEGGGDRLGGAAVADANPDVEPTDDGAFAYAVVRDGNGDDDEGGDSPDRIAEAYVQPDRARVEFVAGQDAAVDAAKAEELRVRPKAVRPPRTLVFVEDGGQVKRVLSAVRAAVEASGT